MDAIVDIVGAALCLEMLGWPKVIASPMPTFHGFAKGAHGVFPLPAPATAELLRGVPWRKLDIEGELVTPTGAAIITGIAAGFGPLPAMTVEKHRLRRREERFRHPERAPGHDRRGGRRHAESQGVAVIETNIDDLNPQFYETAMERLFAAGALDVFLSPIQMKKNRPGTLLSVICDPDRAEAMADIVLAETSTFGVRISRWETGLPGSPLGGGRNRIRDHPDQDRRAERPDDHGLPRVRGLQTRRSRARRTRSYRA